MLSLLRSKGLFNRPLHQDGGPWTVGDRLAPFVMMFLKRSMDDPKWEELSSVAGPHYGLQGHHAMSGQVVYGAHRTLRRSEQKRLNIKWCGQPNKRVNEFHGDSTVHCLPAQRSAT